MTALGTGREDFSSHTHHDASSMAGSQLPPHGRPLDANPNYCCFFFLNNEEIPRIMSTFSCMFDDDPLSPAPPFRENLGFAKVPATVKGNVILPFATFPPESPAKTLVRGFLSSAARPASPW